MLAFDKIINFFILQLIRDGHNSLWSIRNPFHVLLTLFFLVVSYY